ncbi:MULTISPECIES: nucleotide exchange factor GrpE [unclassified Rathayibacter]|uniref:nucleotide exchange factor GrpE n=1 Tax=unclassified Rathayibacter TaxID=2609250 RepID=UPI000CE7523A|nr:MULTISPECIES: nucleotide exchange factor GrpE [unclassified Rathayibacter]PPF12589.1 nucleotide exchange factor GrpE [Rathayibacter sp. AY1A5]PPF29327.1 nucleotide exchange factor GrpE [Rathayibacter sp. AY1F2]PPG10880.1 nucleotide exchange factor GrpE [Rathayibacter sp. AY2B1]PPG43583.1 nucleotide exchange factor GrpE [Rathayibacter sp. AY2B5]PPG54612.1 nucleotide exchange factor GrpE [Rathayibacter sp. AY1E9]
MAAENEPQDLPEEQPVTGGEAGAEAAQDAQDQEGLIEAEGPDVETSLSDADLSFLSGQSSAETLAAEHLADLQRVTAEYANYRKRTEANRQVDKERAIGDAVKVILPVLDDLDRAEKHGDLAEGGPFTAIAQKLRGGVEKLGLVKTGAVGDLFDPNIHEAIFQQPTPGAETSTVADVVEAGYYLGGSLLRAAKVVVAVPAD